MGGKIVELSLWLGDEVGLDKLGESSRLSGSYICSCTLFLSNEVGLGEGLGEML